MSGLVTMRWIVDGDEVHSETVPHDQATIEKLQRSVEITSYGTHTLQIEIEFDPPVYCPPSKETVDA
jgi:hypothetical protein